MTRFTPAFVLLAALALPAVAQDAGHGDHSGHTMKGEMGPATQA